MAVKKRVFLHLSEPLELELAPCGCAELPCLRSLGIWPFKVLILLPCLCTPLHLASAYAWTNTPSSVVWLRDQEPGVHGLSVLGFGLCWSCVLID
jgi:hypothetical protein